jgi:bifunctional DNA-binding transcriptional regulator/antitoxin component of YhaV-PrlF toxin-antitoxin module
MTNTYQTTVEYNEDFDEYYVVLPEELVERLAWEEGDVVEWLINKDGTVLVERVDEFYGDEENDEPEEV